MKLKKLPFVAGLMVTALAAVVSLGAANPVLRDLVKLDQLIEEFNRKPDSIRLVLLLSPT